MPDSAKETVHFGNEADLEAPAVERPSSTATAQVLAIDEPTNICAEETACAELSSVRSEKPRPLLDDTPANAAGLAGEDRQSRQNEPVSAAPVPGTLDDSVARTCPEDAHVSLDHSSMEPGLIETAPPPPSVSERSDAPNLVRSSEEESSDSEEAVASLSPAMSAPEFEMGSRELPPAETVELSGEVEHRDEASWSAGDTEASPQRSAAPIESLTAELESIYQAIVSDRPGALALQEDIPIRTQENEANEPLVAAPLVSIEAPTESLPDGVVPSELASDDELTQASTAWNESMMPASEEAPESIEVVEVVAATEQSNTSPVVTDGTIAPQDEDGQMVVASEEPALATAAAAAISENEVLVLAPQENAPAEALPFEDAVQTGDETLGRTGKECSDLEHEENSDKENEASELLAAPDVAHEAGLAGADTGSRLDETHSQPNSESQPEATSPGETGLPLQVSEQTVDLPVAPPIADVSKQEEGRAEAVDLPTSPSQVASTEIAPDEALSGAWEEAVLHPDADCAHQARLASKKPPEVATKEELSATEPVTELSPLAPEVAGTTATSSDTSFDPIQEIEQELFAPSSIEPAKVPAHETPRARPIEELLPQPTLTEVSPAPSIAVAPVFPAPPSAMAPALQRPSLAPARPIARSMPRPAPADPLATPRAMTDEERIALFS